MKISVTVKDKSKALTQHFPYVYQEQDDGEIRLSKEDPVLKECVDKVLKEFKGTPDKIGVTIKIDW